MYVSRFLYEHGVPILGSVGGDKQEGPEEAPQDRARRGPRGRRADRRRRDGLQRRREGIRRALNGRTTKLTILRSSPPLSSLVTIFSSGKIWYMEMISRFAFLIYINCLVQTTNTYIRTL